jgi:hypothetical protein
MEIIDTSKSLIENLYFLSGPVLASLGFFILYQIKLAKKSIMLADQQLKEAKNYLRTISKREAATMSAKQIEAFIEITIPIGNELDSKRKEVDFPKFEGKIINFTNDEVFSWDIAFTKSYFEKMPSLDNIDLKLINSLEAFATYFTKGIADEEIAFSSIGRVYCGYVETYYPIISLLRGSKQPQKYYNNLIELYRIWKSRFEKFQIEVELEKSKEKIKEEIIEFERIKEKASKTTKTIKPVGTE